MINVVYKPQELTVFVTGHAGAAEKGKDIVCAAVSMLVYTLANAVELHSELYKDSCIDLAEGAAKIQCVPHRGKKDAAMAVFDAICQGFYLAESAYPENVRVTVALGIEKS